jgi:formylglycine-generating enzyme
MSIALEACTANPPSGRYRCDSNLECPVGLSCQVGSTGNKYCSTPNSSASPTKPEAGVVSDGGPLDPQLSPGEVGGTGGQAADAAARDSGIEDASVTGPDVDAAAGEAGARPMDAAADVDAGALGCAPACRRGEACKQDEECASKACIGGICGDCKPETRRCDDNASQKCLSDGTWGGLSPCLAVVGRPVCGVDGACGAPASCSGLSANCGPSRASSCCDPTRIPGSSFLRSFDAVQALDDDFPATLSDFALDRFEVTVGRFRKFVEAGFGVQNAAPATGAGTVAGATASGWKEAWNELLPSTKQALVSALACSPSFSTWTVDASADDARPINCTTWYEAQAFCIWDGGRLPTEAEWNFAASGGDQQRVYPWSVPPTSTRIDPTDASHYVDDTLQCLGDGLAGCTGDDILVAGTSRGEGRWGHADLAGNVGEWVFDYFSETYETPCLDCAQMNAATQRMQRGGSFGSAASTITASWRGKYDDPLARAANVGFRCRYGK